MKQEIAECKVDSHAGECLAVKSEQPGQDAACASGHMEHVAMDSESAEKPESKEEMSIADIESRMRQLRCLGSYSKLLHGITCVQHVCTKV